MNEVKSIGNAEEWKFKAKLEHCQIWQNVYDGSVAQAYSVPIGYLMREEGNFLKRRGGSIVEVLGFLTTRVANHQNTYVLIERIPVRLAQVHTLTEVQCLKVLYSIYKNLEYIQKMWGEFEITQNCICFNTRGEVKVWINQDLWCNHPSRSNLYKKHFDSNFVWKVFRMVEKKAMNPKILEIFKQIQKQEQLSYQEACKMVINTAQNLFLDIGIHLDDHSSYRSSQNDIKSDLKEIKKSGQTRISLEKKRILSSSLKKRDINFNFKSKQFLDRIRSGSSSKSEKGHSQKQNQSRKKGFSEFYQIKKDFEAGASQNLAFRQGQRQKMKKNQASPKSSLLKKNIVNIHETLEKNALEHEQKDQKTAAFIELNEDKQNKQYILDVAMMEKQLVRFNEKKKREKQETLQEKTIKFLNERGKKSDFKIKWRQSRQEKENNRSINLQVIKRKIFQMKKKVKKIGEGQCSISKFDTKYNNIEKTGKNFPPLNEID